MQGTRNAMVAMAAVVLLVSGCRQDQVAEKYHPATIDSTEVEGIMRVTLDSRAAERLGIQTAPLEEVVLQVPGLTVTRTSKVLPYAALMYDTKGETWTFTNPKPLVFVRHKVVVDDIDGDRVLLAEGPPAGTAVVTVGAAELMGAEHKYGH
jgi:hypothetical protein